jgi:tetratricopeptide (TPR) repeat protein
MGMAAKTREQAAPAERAAGIDDYLALSAACVKQGALDDAIATLRAAHQAAPHHLGVLSNLGGLLSRQGAHDEALAILRQVLAQSPNSAFAHYNLAVGLRGAHQPAAAVAHFERSVALKPGFAEGHRGLGDTLLDLDRLTNAAAAYERAFVLKRDPGRPMNPDLPLHSNRSRLRHDAEQFRYRPRSMRWPPAMSASRSSCPSPIWARRRRSCRASSRP